MRINPELKRLKQKDTQCNTCYRLGLCLYKKLKCVGWLEGSVVQSTCSCRGLRFGSQHSHDGSQPFVTEVLGAPAPAPPLHRHQAHTWQAYKRQDSHTHKIKDTVGLPFLKGHWPPVHGGWREREWRAGLLGWSQPVRQLCFIVPAVGYTGALRSNHRKG